MAGICGRILLLRIPVKFFVVLLEIFHQEKLHHGKTIKCNEGQLLLHLSGRHLPFVRGFLLFFWRGIFVYL